MPLLFFARPNFRCFMKYYPFALFFLLGFLAFYGCSNTGNSASSLALFNGVSLEMLPDEKESPILPGTFQQYRSFFQSENTVPLYKYIEGPDYQMFIGLPFESDSIDYTLRKMDLLFQKHDSIPAGQISMQALKDSIQSFHIYNLENNGSILRFFMVKSKVDSSQFLQNFHTFSRRIQVQ